MKLIFYIGSLIVLMSYSVQAQEKSIFTLLAQPNSETGGQVQLHQDAETKALVNDYIKAKKEEKGMMGYRVQIFFASGHFARKNANKIRNSFVAKYKETKAHVVFEEPNFKVRVGDFRTKSEALKVLVEIEEEYKGAYIVKDFIEFPELKIEDSEKSPQ